MKRLTKAVFSGVPGTVCNLNCSYCYVGENKGQKGTYAYPVEHMLKCFEPERFGGPVYFEGTGGGETLLWSQIVDFTEGMLSYGHVVAYTTNMTIAPVIEKFCDFHKNLRDRLVLGVSLHYLELKRKKLLDTFLANLSMLKSAGISFFIAICISDDYLGHLREIRDLFENEIGLLPQANMMRDYNRGGAKTAVEYSANVNHLVEETCDVRPWKLQKHIFGHRRTEFCHAGEYSISLDLGTGDYTKCWGNSGLGKNWRKLLARKSELVRKVPLVNNRVTNRIFGEPSQIMGNLFKDPNEPVRFEPIGKCPFYDCVCAAYQCFGLIPELNVETFSRTYFTREFVSKEAWDLMDSKIN
jgi:MoaA/NifB/PqqE/SkfB family radical SAM enzyme